MGICSSCWAMWAGKYLGVLTLAKIGSYHKAHNLNRTKSAPLRWLCKPIWPTPNHLNADFSINISRWRAKFFWIQKVKITGQFWFFLYFFSSYWFLKGLKIRIFTSLKLADIMKYIKIGRDGEIWIGWSGYWPIGFLMIFHGFSFWAFLVL